MPPSSSPSETFPSIFIIDLYVGLAGSIILEVQASSSLSFSSFKGFELLLSLSSASALLCSSLRASSSSSSSSYQSYCCQFMSSQLKYMFMYDWAFACAKVPPPALLFSSSQKFILCIFRGASSNSIMFGSTSNGSFFCSSNTLFLLFSA